MSILFTRLRTSAERRECGLILAGLRGSLVSALAFAVSAISLVVASQPGESDDDRDHPETVALVANNASRSAGF